MKRKLVIITTVVALAVLGLLLNVLVNKGKDDVAAVRPLYTNAELRVSYVTDRGPQDIRYPHIWGPRGESRFHESGFGDAKHAQAVRREFLGRQGTGDLLRFTLIRDGKTCARREVLFCGEPLTVFENALIHVVLAQEDNDP